MRQPVHTVTSAATAECVTAQSLSTDPRTCANICAHVHLCTCLNIASIGTDLHLAIKVSGPWLEACVSTCVLTCADMCGDMRADMCVESCMDMCVAMRVDMWVDMCVDMC